MLANNNRLAYIAKERDKESSLADHGVRKYDAEIGRFTSCDALWGKYISLTPYQYSGNNPISFVDGNGFEPVKSCAGTINQFLFVFNNSPSKIGQKVGRDGEDALISLGETEFNWKKLRNQPENTPYFNEKKGRYIYTKNGGWIDMVHFLFYAGKALQYKKDGIKNPIGEAVQDGYLQEEFDGLSSRFSYEDLPSDKYGAEFAVKYYNPYSIKSLGEQIEDYLINVLGATNPENARNYNRLPDSHDDIIRPTYKNFDTNPLLFNY